MPARYICSAEGLVTEGTFCLGGDWWTCHGGKRIRVPIKYPEYRSKVARLFFLGLLTVKFSDSLAEEKSEVEDVGIFRGEGEICGAMWLFPDRDHRVSGHVFNGTSLILSSRFKSTTASYFCCIKPRMNRLQLVKCKY